GVVKALEARREPREFVTTEIARAHSGRDHQEVELEFSNANPRASDLDGTKSQVDAPNLGQQHAEVLLPRLQLPDRSRYFGWRQDSGGDLVEERLKDMVVTSVDQRDLHVSSLECARCGDACKSRTHYQNTLLWANCILDNRAFRRKAFGEDCR